jgi:hypothetical protein
MLLIFSWQFRSARYLGKIWLTSLENRQMNQLSVAECPFEISQQMSRTPTNSRTWINRPNGGKIGPRNDLRRAM